MGMKRGFIWEEDTPAGSHPPAIRRFRLQSGVHVHLPSPMAEWLLANYASSEEIFFLERGILARTEWVGDEYALRHALAEGQLSHRDLDGIRMEGLQATDGWYPVPWRYDHVPGALAKLAAMLVEQGKPELAHVLTPDRWIEEANRQRRCLAKHEDRLHGDVVCELLAQHGGHHVPVCAACVISYDVIHLQSRRVSRWART